jgi:tetratricopeptide (TPR) repeat protein
MEIKDYISIALSFAAFCFAIASFFVSYRQRGSENERSSRKALTDVVAELSKVNLAQAQIDLDHPGSTRPEIIAFKRNYTSQRRYLAYHGDFLCQQIPDLINDIDAVAIASAFDSAGDLDRAERYFNVAVEKSPSNALRATNLRAIARFSFSQGQAAQGRALYEQALQQSLPDTDGFRRFTADTFMIWARVEKDNGFGAESVRVTERAISAANRIGNANSRNDMLKAIAEAVPPFQNGKE